MKEGERMAKEWTNGFYTSKEWRKTRDAYYRFQCGRCERCMAEVLAGVRRVEEPRNNSSPQKRIDAGEHKRSGGGVVLR